MNRMAAQKGAQMRMSKKQCAEQCREYLIPGRIAAFENMGVMPILASAEGYRFRDMNGREFQDFHLNGGTFNLGHRNPQLLKTLRRNFRQIGIGNHHFASKSRAELAKRLAATVPGLKYTVFTTSGSEANDVAIKSARWATRRKRIVSLAVGYHGRSGLAGAAGDADNAKFFLSSMSDDFRTVPFNDLDSMETALKSREVAAVILESLPATYGFQCPDPGYFRALSGICRRYGTLYIADEVQTGMGRTGALWSISALGIEPDILVTAKGLSGGIYPIAAAVLSERAGAWLKENGWGHVSTFGGADVACRIGLQALDLCADPSNLEHASTVAAYLRAGITEIQSRTGYLKNIHGIGLAMGLEFDSPSGGVDMMKALYDRGLWAMFASFNSAVLQFKPGFLVDFAYCDEALQRLEDAVQAVKLQPQGRSIKLAGGLDHLSAAATAA